MKLFLPDGLRQRKQTTHTHTLCKYDPLSMNIWNLQMTDKSVRAPIIGMHAHLTGLIARSDKPASISIEN